MRHESGDCVCFDDDSNTALINISNTQFSENVVTLGGGISTVCGYLNVEDTIFLNSSAFEHGGGISARYNGKLSNSEFTSNHAGTFGGGAYLSWVDSFNVHENTSFYSIEANVGAGIYYAHCTNVNIDNVELLSNIASFGGAGLAGSISDLTRNTNAIPTISWDSILFDNNSAIFGAGAYVHSYEFMDLLFKSNTTTKYWIDSLNPNDPIEDEVSLLYDEYWGELDKIYMIVEFVSGNLADEAIIPILEMSLKYNDYNTTMYPFVKISTNSYYEVSDLSPCETLESNNLVGFIGELFDNDAIASPAVCQAQECLSAFMCDSDTTVILWSEDNRHTELYLESDSYYLDAPYYSMDHTNLSFISSDNYEYNNYSNCINTTDYEINYNTNNNDMTVNDTIVVVMSGKYCDNVGIIDTLQSFGARAVIIAQTEESIAEITTAEAPEIDESTYLLTTCTVTGTSLGMFINGGDEFIIDTYDKLLGFNTESYSSYYIYDNTTITFELKSRVSAKNRIPRKCKYLNDSSYL